MNGILEYKGYITKVEYIPEDQLLFGKIEGIEDLITFESDDAKKIEQEFHDAVDDYLIFCEEVGKEPNKTYKGTFNIRIDPRLHKKISLLAIRNDKSLNQEVEKAIKSYVEAFEITLIDNYDKIDDLSNMFYKNYLYLWNNFPKYKLDSVILEQSTYLK